MLSYISTDRYNESSRSLVLVRAEEPLYFQIIHSHWGYEHKPSPAFSAHGHSELFHIVLFTRDGGDFSYGNRNISPRPGQLFLISPGDRHSFHTSRESSFYDEVTFALYSKQKDSCIGELSFISLFSLFSGEACEERSMPFFLDRTTTEKTSLCFRRLLEGLNLSGPGSGLICREALRDLLSHIWWSCYAPPFEKGKSDNTLVQAHTHIEDHYREQISSDSLANLAGCSRGHFFRSFKERYHITAREYQTQLRIGAAVSLLQSGSLPLKAIADQLGYCDVYHFSRVFKEETGLSPGQYRKKGVY